MYSEQEGVPRRFFLPFPLLTEEGQSCGEDLFSFALKFLYKRE